MKATHDFVSGGIATFILAGCNPPSPPAQVGTVPVKLSADLPALARPGSDHRAQTLFFDPLLSMAVANVKFEIRDKGWTKLPDVSAKVASGNAEANIRLAPGEYFIEATGFGTAPEGPVGPINALSQAKDFWNLVDGQGTAIAFDMYQRLETGKRYSSLKLATGAEDRYFFEALSGSRYRIRVWDDLGGDMAVHGAYEEVYAPNRFEGAFLFRDDNNDVHRNGEAVEALSQGFEKFWFRVASRMGSAGYNVEIEECATSDVPVTIVAR